MTRQRMYNRLPTLLQHGIVSGKGLTRKRLRLGGGFPELLARAESRFTCTADELEYIRNARLIDHLRFAVSAVPAYSDLAIEDVAADLQRRPAGSLLRDLPLLTKQHLQERRAEYSSALSRVPGSVGVSTGGTTGTGLSLRFTPLAIREQWAIWWRYRQWHGIEVGTWCAHFGGQIVVGPHRDRPPYWRYDVPGRRIYFSTSHLSEATAPYYLMEIQRRRIRWLHGHPSILSLLAAYAEAVQLDLRHLRWVTTGAETLLPHQRERMTRAFRVPVRQHYGLVEGVANVSECDLGRNHIDEDFAFVELLPSGVTGLCRVVGTNLSNRATVLIRYETGDLVEPLTGPCPCGRPGRLVGPVQGRREDFILAPSGGLVGPINQIFSGLTGVREGQVVQEPSGRLVVLVIPGPKFGETDIATLERRLAERVGGRVELELRIVEALRRTDAGKLLPARLTSTPRGSGVSTRGSG